MRRLLVSIGARSIGKTHRDLIRDTERGAMGYKVWIDQDLCTGDGICVEIAPQVFTLLDDGLAYVKDGTGVKSDPGGPAGIVDVPDAELDGVIDSAEECPGECIFIEAS